jgi:crotonobetainyl-CoA:carnitine CoA-transferase CaiB-like acyl-CoA transferase
MNHPDLGTITFPQGALAAVLERRMTAAPRLGEHTDQILNELRTTPAPRGK